MVEKGYAIRVAEACSQLHAATKQVKKGSRSEPIVVLIHGAKRTATLLYDLWAGFSFLGIFDTFWETARTHTSRCCLSGENPQHKKITFQKLPNSLFCRRFGSRRQRERSAGARPTVPIQQSARPLGSPQVWAIQSVQSASVFTAKEAKILRGILPFKNSHRSLEMRPFGALTAAVATLVPVACNAKTIMDYLRTDDRLYEARSIAEEAGILDDIDPSRFGTQLTLMLPSNEAFDQLHADHPKWRRALINNKQNVETVSL